MCYWSLSYTGPVYKRRTGGPLNRETMTLAISPCEMADLHLEGTAVELANETASLSQMATWYLTDYKIQMKWPPLVQGKNPDRRDSFSFSSFPSPGC